MGSTDKQGSYKQPWICKWGKNIDYVMPLVSSLMLFYASIHFTKLMWCQYFFHTEAGVMDGIYRHAGKWQCPKEVVHSLILVSEQQGCVLIICAPFFIDFLQSCLITVVSSNIVDTFPDVCSVSRMTETGGGGGSIGVLVENIVYPCACAQNN